MTDRFEPFETDTRGWLTLIVGEYDRIVADIPALAEMRPANIQVSEKMTSTLGMWDEERRTITLSDRLLRGPRWQLLIRVIKHEMAHQVVSEVFGIEDAVPHQEAFRRACRLLGVDDAATIDPADLDAPSGEGAVHRKIRKLLALGESPNRHEAEAALAKASYLAMKYNIDLVERGAPDGYEFRLIGTPRKRVPSYTWVITQIVTDHYFVRYICRACDDKRHLIDGGRYQVIELYGTPDNLDLAEYVYTYLVHQGELEWVGYKREHDLPNNRQKLSFLTGLYTGFAETLDDQRDRLAETKALVWLGDPGLDAFYRQRNPHVTTARSKARYHHDAHGAGMEAGARMQIRPGIRSRKKSGRIRGYLRSSGDE